MGLDNYWLYAIHSVNPTIIAGEYPSSSCSRSSNPTATSCTARAKIEVEVRRKIAVRLVVENPS